MDRLALIALFLASSSAEAQGVFRGPYLNDVTPDSVVVVWETPADSTGVVRYGVNLLDQMLESNTPTRHHEVRLTNLSALAAAGSEFRYEVEVDGTMYPGSFRTMPPPGTPFRFIVYGDNRSSPQQHQLVVDALQTEQPRPHFAVNTGDLVSNGESEADWDAFFPVASPLLSSMPLYVAIGNHEVDGGSFSLTERLFVLPTGVAPASNEEGYYRVIYGNVELIVINVEVDTLYTLPILAGDQEDWLESVLADRAAGVEHRFVFIHQGPYSSKVGRNGNYWLRRWLDDMDTADIDVVFSGHDHYLERGWARPGIWYLIHGGGGAPLYETLGPRVTDDHTIVHSESRLGYVVVEIDGPRARVVAKGLAGEIVDEFTYGDAANPACSAATDCGAAPINACPDGEWDCHRNACLYVCDPSSSSLIACTTDQDCVDLIGANCPGTPTCERPSLNPTAWYCQCTLPPECTAAADCANRPPPIPGCEGTWDCVDEQCEFTTTMCMPIDAGVVIDASAPEDASLAKDSAIEDASMAEPDAAMIEADATAIDSGTQMAIEPESSCSCRAQSSRGSSAIVWLALLILTNSRQSRGAAEKTRTSSSAAH